MLVIAVPRPGINATVHFQCAVVCLIEQDLVPWPLLIGAYLPIMWWLWPDISVINELLSTA